MNVNCPYCDKQLKIGGKIEATLKQLAPGKLIKVKCAQCAEGFGINSDIEVSGLNGNGSANYT